MQSQAERAIEFLQWYFTAEAHLSTQESASAQAVVDAPRSERQRRLDFDLLGEADERQH